MRERIQLGQSDLRVTPICLGAMTFGEQVAERDAHAVMDRAVERGLNFLDTAEMYPVPARRETYGATETIIGTWLAARPGLRQKIVLASKVAGPSRGMPWVRAGEGMTPEDVAAARRYNALARQHGLTPTRMAPACCYTRWQVASTIVGVTSLAQLDEDLDAWGTNLSPELLAEIDQVRWELRDPAA